MGARFAGSVRRVLGHLAVVAARGELAEQGVQAEVDALLRGTARVDLSARRDTLGTTLRHLRVEASGLTAQVQGKIASSGSDLAGTLAFADLGVLGAGYGGALQGTARLTGNWAEGGAARALLSVNALAVLVLGILPGALMTLCANVITQSLAG